MKERGYEDCKFFLSSSHTVAVSEALIAYAEGQKHKRMETEPTFPKRVEKQAKCKP